MSVVSPDAELIDPTPDIRRLFLEFNDRFFESKLSGCEVKWSPRMTLCAGLCHYERRGGFCSIRLSAALLKFRPRKDLVETLLHEMIHAYLFVTRNDRDHDAHGPEFHKHMHRINRTAGTNITVYHNFHAEVAIHHQHWWRCNGPCRNRRPFYGYVKRASNRAPAPNDFWWAEHQRSCGGTFIKVKEPDGYKQKKGKVAKLMNPSTVGPSTMQLSSSSNVKPHCTTPPSSSTSVYDLENAKSQRSIMDYFTKTSFVPFSGKGYVLGSSKLVSGLPPDVTQKKASDPVAVIDLCGSSAEPADSPEFFNEPCSDYDSRLVSPSCLGTSSAARADTRDGTIECPVCCSKVSFAQINEHLDICLC